MVSGNNACSSRSTRIDSSSNTKRYRVSFTHQAYTVNRWHFYNLDLCAHLWVPRYNFSSEKINVELIKKWLKRFSPIFQYRLCCMSVSSDCMSVSWKLALLMRLTDSGSITAKPPSFSGKSLTFCCLSHFLQKRQASTCINPVRFDLLLANPLQRMIKLCVMHVPRC